MNEYEPFLAGRVPRIRRGFRPLSIHAAGSAGKTMTRASRSGFPSASWTVPFNCIGRSVNVITTFAVSVAFRSIGVSEMSTPSAIADFKVQPAAEPRTRSRYFPGGSRYVLNVPDASIWPGGIDVPKPKPEPPTLDP